MWNPTPPFSMQWKSELQSALGICGSASTYSVNLRLCSVHLVQKKKKFTCKWTHAVQSHVVQGSTILNKFLMGTFQLITKPAMKKCWHEQKLLSLPSISLQSNMEADMKINNYSTTQLDNIYKKRHETEIATISVKLSKWLRDRLFILFT